MAKPNYAFAKRQKELEKKRKKEEKKLLKQTEGASGDAETEEVDADEVASDDVAVTPENAPDVK